MTDPCGWSGFQCNTPKTLLKSLTWTTNLGISVSGTISPSLGSLTSLNDLEIIGQSGLTGFLPNQMSGLTGLLNLVLSQNGLSRAVPSSLFAGMSGLQNLEISSNSFNSAIPSSIASLASVTALILNGNQFSGTLPPSLFQGLTKLLQLNVGDNRLSGSIPSSLCSISSLTSLTLQVTASSSATKNTFSCVPQW